MNDSDLAAWSARKAQELQARHNPEDEKILTAFPFSVGDQKKVDVWLASHRQSGECPFKESKSVLTDEEYYMGAIGGGLTYSFTPTGLGMVIKVKCACGSQTDITDYDSW